MYLNVVDIKEHKDGSATVDIEYDKEVADFVKKYYKRKRLSKKLMERFVIEGLTNYLEQEEKKRG